MLPIGGDMLTLVLNALNTNTGAPNYSDLSFSQVEVQWCHTDSL